MIRTVPTHHVDLQFEAFVFEGRSSGTCTFDKLQSYYGTCIVIFFWKSAYFNFLKINQSLYFLELFFYIQAPNPNVDSWTLNSTLCGNVQNAHLTSPNNLLKLEMSTDRWVNSRGFKATAKSGNIPFCPNLTWFCKCLPLFLFMT